MLRIEKSVQDLRNTLEKMSNLVIDMVRHIKTSLDNENLSELEFIFKQDARLDTLEKELDGQAVALLALINPMASDLRFVFSVIKLNADLERMGDECKNVAKEMQNLQFPLPEEIKNLAAMVYAMVTDAMKALLNQDPKLSREIVIRDDEVDKLEYEILQKFPNRVALAFVAKALERISDHTTNIAENVVFATEGKDIRHENTIMNRL